MKILKPNRDLARILVNSTWFNIGWFACLYFGDTAAWVVLPLTLILHAYVIPLTPRQWGFVALLTPIGILVDTVFSLTGVLEFGAGIIVPPFWLVTMWILFATLLMVTLFPLIPRRLVFIPLCALGGMFSYTAGVAISDSSFGLPHSIAMPLMAAAWAVIGIIIRALHARLFPHTEQSYA